VHAQVKHGFAWRQDQIVQHVAGLIIEHGDISQSRVAGVRDDPGEDYQISHGCGTGRTITRDPDRRSRDARAGGAGGGGDIAAEAELIASRSDGINARSAAIVWREVTATEVGCLSGNKRKRNSNHNGIRRRPIVHDSYVSDRNAAGIAHASGKDEQLARSYCIRWALFGDRESWRRHNRTDGCGTGCHIAAEANITAAHRDTVGNVRVADIYRDDEIAGEAGGLPWC